MHARLPPPPPWEISHRPPSAVFSSSDEAVDKWIHTVTDRFERLVHDDIRMALHHRREVALNTKVVIDGRATVAFNEREKVIET